MMELLRLEHKKLWHKRSVQIGVLFCFLYVIIFGNLLSYQWFTFGSADDFTSSFGNRFDGYTNIRKKQEYAKQWERDLTDETLQAMVRDYQKRAGSNDISEYEMTDWEALNAWVQTLWPELEEADQPYIMLSYVDPSQLTGFEERREKALENFLDMNGQTGEEKEYFLNMNTKVDTPLQYRWTKGWTFVTADFVSQCGVVLGIFLAIGIAPMFCGEWHDRTKALIATTKNGWKKIAGVKVMAAVLFTLELYGIITVSSVFLQIVFLGTEGWDMPIQCIKILAAAPWNVLQAEIYEYIYLLLAALGYTGIVLLCSALTKSNYISLLISLAIIFVPMAVSQFLPLWGQRLLDLIPFVGSSTDIFRTNTYPLFGLRIWSPYLLITAPISLGLISLPFAVYLWSKRARI